MKHISLNKKKSILIAIGWLLCVFVGNYYKINFLHGSTKSFLTGISMVVPIIGHFYTMVTSLSLCGILWVSKYMINGLPITMGIPTIAATIMWAHRYKKNSSIYSFIWHTVLTIIIPLACIVYFTMHPTVQYGWPFALYWFIPITIGIFQYNNQANEIFFKALQSTFFAHAIGSIIWLQKTSMTPDQWCAIIPLVAIERLTIASMNVILCVALTAVVKKFMYNKTTIFSFLLHTK